MYKRKKKSHADYIFVFLVIILVLLGLIFIADASSPIALRDHSDKYFFFKNQAKWTLVGAVAFVLVANINYKLWRKMAIIMFAASVVLLVALFIPGLGSKLLGAKRWIVLGPVNFQPSEIVKFTIAIYIAKVAENKMKMSAYVVPLAIVVFLVMLQPDLGTSLVVISIVFGQLFLSSQIKVFEIIKLIVAGIVGILGLILVSDYRRERLVTFLSETQDPLGKGYHIRQILFALGSGGMWGVGLGQSRQKQLFLPETAADSIFAVIAEEIGFIGSAFILFLYIYLIYRGLLIVKKAPDVFSQVLSGGLVSWITAQTFLNLGSIVALVPLTGIPLPFLSYGGTSLVSLLIACGILVQISSHSHEN